MYDEKDLETVAFGDNVDVIDAIMNEQYQSISIRYKLGLFILGIIIAFMVIAAIICFHDKEPEKVEIEKGDKINSIYKWRNK